MTLRRCKAPPKGTQGRKMRVQMLKTDAVDDLKKDRKAHWRTLASEPNKACILLLLRITRNFDQNVYPVRGTYYANKRTYMEKSLYGKILKVLSPKGPTLGPENFAQNVGPWTRLYYAHAFQKYFRRFCFSFIFTDSKLFVYAKIWSRISNVANLIHEFLRKHEDQTWDMLWSVNFAFQLKLWTWLVNNRKKN